MYKTNRKKVLSSFTIGELDNYYTLQSIALSLMAIDKEYKKYVKQRLNLQSTKR